MAKGIKNWLKEFGLKDENGEFNANVYLPHIQVLGRAQASNDTPFVDTIGSSSVGKLARIEPIFETPLARIIANAKTKVSRKFATQDLVKAFDRACSVEPHLWTPRRMHGAEYEGGRFQWQLVYAAMRGDLESFQMDLDVNTEILPSAETVNTLRGMAGDKDLQIPTLRQDWGSVAGVDIPQTIPATLYAIAPAGSVQATKGFLQTLAAQDQEMTSHRGIGFNRGVAYRNLDHKEKARLGLEGEDNIAWFDVNEKIFFTTSRVLFNSMKTVMGLEREEQPQGPAPVMQRLARI